MTQDKAFEIPKTLIWKSYLEVRKNRGAAGCDGQTIKQFDENRDKNLYKIWNRLSSGSYFPPPVREKKIPKGDGKERVLGIPTVSDRARSSQAVHGVKARSFVPPGLLWLPAWKISAPSRKAVYAAMLAIQLGIGN